MDDLIKYNSTTPAIYTPAESAILESIKNSRKILEMTKKEIALECNSFILKAHVDAGFTINGGNQAMLILSDSIADDLFTYFRTLTINEVGIAIKNGIRGEYGSYMGINVKTVHQFCKAYKESFDRNEVLRKNTMQTDDEPTLDEAEKKRIMDEACIKAFDEYKKTGKLTDFGGAKFKHLKEHKVITLTQERYKEIMDRAILQVKAEAAESIYKSGQDSTASVIAKAIMANAGSHEVTKNAARLIALKEYFDFLIENEFEVKDMINNME